MEFLDKAILPQSAHHMVLIKYLIVVAFILMIPYLSLLLGNLTYSLYFRKRAIKENNEDLYKLSDDLIEMITFNKSVAFALGIVPMLSAMFGFAQLLNLTNASVHGYLFISLLFLFNALLLIYSYKNGFLFKIKISDENPNLTDIEKNRIAKQERAVRIFGKSGKYGIVLLLISIYLFCGAIQLSFDTERWESVGNIGEMVFSFNALVSFAQFIISAFLITSAMILYRYFRTNSEDSNYSDEFKSYIRDFVLLRGLLASILLLLFVVLSVMMRSKLSLSYGVFGYSVFALCLILIVSSLFYVMLKESHTKYNSSLIFLVIVIVFVLIIRDQYSFDVSTKKQYAILAANYETYQAKINEQLGIGEAPINGADIYNGRCIACHTFDKKIVGPPYNSTMPKYEGKKDLLVKYILNPSKINPDYPAMPNQGLKPNEAEAVAEYLLTTYKKMP
ncbi:MAG: cytochrome c [Melioribacteraceae bacterium]